MENISAHRKGKMTKSEFDPEVASTEQKTNPKSALNASGNIRGEVCGAIQNVLISVNCSSEHLEYLSQ